MTAPRPIALDLDPETGARLARLADALNKPAEALLRDAVAQFVAREEYRQSFQTDAQQAWDRFLATGQHVTHAQADAWLARLEAGETEPAPECHR